MHATKGLSGAPASLVASGRRALHAMMGKMRSSHITQLDMRCRMFDVLVEPVLSYASHVWGPSVFAPCISKGQHLSADADSIHLHFLRMLTGTGKKGCADVLVRDMHIMHISGGPLGFLV
jgi:hypothetical protein